MCFVLVKFHQWQIFQENKKLTVVIYVVIINTNKIFIQFLQWNWHICVNLVITMLKFKILSTLLVHSLVQFHHFNHINDNFMPQKKTLLSYCTKHTIFVLKIFSNFYCFLFFQFKILEEIIWWRCDTIKRKTWKGNQFCSHK